MKRRQFLISSTALGAATLSGCIGSDDSEESDSDTDIQDSDGDGVIDSEDYAPHDPDVQQKSDLQSETNSTTSSTTSTTESTTEPTSNGNGIQVDKSDFSTAESRFVEYSLTNVRVYIHPDDPAVTETANQALWIIGADYSREGIHVSKRKSVDLTQSASQVTVDVEWESKPVGEPLHYMMILAPEDVDYEDLSGSNTSYLTETDAFEIQSDRQSIEKTAISEIEELGDDRGERYERTNREGQFALSFSGRTRGRTWDVNFVIYKSAYVAAVRRDHGRRRSQFVTYEMANGFAGELATILSDEAEKNDYTGKREKVGFVIDFIQFLPYVPDDVSTDFDDYTKYCTESLVELGGDCEDSAILLASVLQAEPFEYDMVLLQPPGHMAAGIYGKDDLPGYYWEYDGRKYYYIETTGVGWGVGDLPDEYKDEEAYVHPV